MKDKSKRDLAKMTHEETKKYLENLDEDTKELYRERLINFYELIKNVRKENQERLNYLNRLK